jgi:hypothetical protein
LSAIHDELLRDERAARRLDREHPVTGGASLR